MTSFELAVSQDNKAGVHQRAIYSARLLYCNSRSQETQHRYTLKGNADIINA